MQNTTNQSYKTETSNGGISTKTYRAALYARRKFTDLVQPDEQNPTALEQINAMKKYLKDLPDVRVEGVYMDSRKIDSSQPRPQFQKLLLDIQAGKYNCVVMNSLDTFGRDVNENKYYVLRQFTTLGLRIISILDNYDSCVSELGNDAFPKLEEVIRLNMRFDKSRRRTALVRKYNEKGYIIAKRNIPYGYKYSPDAASGLEVDSEVAPYIRYIYEEYAAGTGPTRIAKALTDLHAPSPSMRKSQLGVKYKKTSPNDYWTSGSVSGILNNQIYTGDFIYGTDRGSIYINRDYERLHRPGEKHIIPNHHEPIIDRELFDQVQERLEENRNRLQAKKKNYDLPEYSATPFRKQLFCGHCGRPMYFYHDVRVHRHYTVYVCSSRSRKLDNACSYAPIQLNEILSAVKEVLLQERRFALSIYEQMKEGTDSIIYQQLERYFQEKIDNLVEAGKRVNSELASPKENNQEYRTTLLEKDTQLRQELVAAIDEKKTFQRSFKVTNPWLMLYANLSENFDITLETARKYIYRIFLYSNAPLEFQVMKQEAKENLLSYFRLINSHGNKSKESRHVQNQQT